MNNIESKELTLGDLTYGQCFLLVYQPPNSAFSRLLRVPDFDDSERSCRALKAGLSKLQIYGTHQDSWYALPSDTPVILVHDGHAYYRKQQDDEELNRAKKLCQANGYLVLNYVVEWRPQEERPEDGQHIAYRFEPFGTYHCGVYDSASDSVSGGSGFTSWMPEVTQWYRIPMAGYDSPLKPVTKT